MNNVLKDEDFKRKFPIELVKHNSEWISRYEDEKKNLLVKLKKYKTNLYHVGSTAIPNIYSKDIIDIILEINEIDSFNSIIDILNIEWELRWKEDNRAFLVKGFRDILIENPKVAKQYERLKLDLELTYKYDREGYTAGKTKFIKDVIKQYGLHN